MYTMKGFRPFAAAVGGAGGGAAIQNADAGAEDRRSDDEIVGTGKAEPSDGAGSEAYLLGSSL